MQGIFGKYIIEKADGSAVDPDACYFVLRLDTDINARTAMHVYAALVKGHLGADITACLNELDSGHEPHFSRIWRHCE